MTRDVVGVKICDVLMGLHHPNMPNIAWRVWWRVRSVVKRMRLSVARNRFLQRLRLIFTRTSSRSIFCPQQLLSAAVTLLLLLLLVLLPPKQWVSWCDVITKNRAELLSRPSSVSTVSCVMSSSVLSKIQIQYWFLASVKILILKIFAYNRLPSASFDYY